MKRLNYLEFILTVNALLLGGMLWFNLADAPLPTTVAPALAQDVPMGIPNAAAQRQEMIHAIRNVSADIRALRSDLQTMEFKTRVTAMPAGMNAASDKRNSERSDQSDPPMVQVNRGQAGNASTSDSK